MSNWPPKADESLEVEPTTADRRVELIERLFREHNEALVRFVRPRVRSHQEALEVAQEAYVRLLNLDAPGAVSYLRSFLFRTAANIAIDMWRRDQTHERATDQPQLHAGLELRTPERRVAGEQVLNRLGKLIEALPPKCRQSFVWHQVQGVDTATIASRLGITESMVRKYVVRALLHCRERLDLEELEPGPVQGISGAQGGSEDE